MKNIEKLRFDPELEIAVAPCRLSKKWHNKTWRWSEILERCAETKRTGESMREYLRMSREEQSSIKDVGGFVGGYLANGVRKTANVLSRSMVTLDIDFGTPDVWDDFTLNFDCAAMVYSTHKHTPEKPRLRLVLPASRPMSPFEYEPVCRYWTSRVGIDMFDHTTYQLPRLFYWPSTSRDGTYFFDYQDGPPFDVDKVLATYRDPRDVSAWPMSSHEGEVLAHEIRKAGDPTEKPGLIGAFCRVYSIEDAIAKFLPEIYDKTATEGRYTYRAGSVAGGLVTYDGKFAYSHHETDPASLKLCNAFDLVRIHLFGVHDEGSRVSDVTSLPSYIKMQEFVAADKEVRVLLTRERLAEANNDFAAIDINEAAQPEEAETGWMSELDYDKKGNVRSTINNVALILENDPGVKGKFYLNLLGHNVSIEGKLPWRVVNPENWEDNDDANLRAWLERSYGICGKEKIKDGFAVVATKYQRHPIREYLRSLAWDGTPRLERLIIDYLGAEDSALNRTVTRIHFTAAVARVMQPGCKYDYCLILAGPQGVGKSTLISIMGGRYYKDGITSMEGKEAKEQIRYSHLVEIGELDGMKRSELSAVKQFLTATEDEYRPAFGRHNVKLPRQCVFFGTTNERYFLKDDTGSRRFPIIPINPDLRKHGDRWFEELRGERDQLWAEAVEYWKRGDDLYLTGELEREARRRQEEYSDSQDDPLLDMLTYFIDMKLPPSWPTWELNRRRAWLKNPDPLSEEGTVTRDRVCAAEFICEYMGRDRADKEYKYLSRKVYALLEGLGWRRLPTSRHAERLYGLQRSFERPTFEPDPGNDDV